jgi:tetratricopeptide (TPR) repeat protein
VRWIIGQKNGVFYNPVFSPQTAGMNSMDNTPFSDTLVDVLETSADTALPENKVEDLLRLGEMSLIKGDLSKAARYFADADQLEPENASMLLRQGLAYFEYGSTPGKEKILLLACKKLKLAALLSSSIPEAWHAWGNALFILGITSKEHHYFQDAEEKYRKALELGSSYELLADLYWDYGSVWLQIAQHSSEAVDFRKAIDALTQASTIREQFPGEFWNDFGCASLGLAERINDIRLYVKAINCFKQTVSLSIDSFQGWTNLAHALELLYAETHDEDHFSQANECYASAAQLKPQDTDLWLSWARFLLESGRHNQDIKRLRSSIEKCHRAYVCDPDLPLASAIWGEALALIGDYSDRLELLYEAENKVSAALQLADNSPEVFYSYGMCLLSFGRYYHDFDYYFQAIEKFQEGLSINRTCSKLWYALAKAYAALGDLEEDLEVYEKSLRFFQKAMDLDPSSTIIFEYALTLSKYGEETDDEKLLEQAIYYFEKALNIQKNALYLHPDWLFHYACTLDMMGDYHEEDTYYVRAIEIFSHVLMIDPDFPGIHHNLALAFSHLGELMGETEHFYRALHHHRLASKRDEENDQILLDLALCLINIAERIQDAAEIDQLYREAEHKITQSARLGNEHAYYHLSCLYSLLGQYDKALRFLQKSEELKTLPPLDEILSDDWLDGLRSTSDFREFLSQIEKR